MAEIKATHEEAPDNTGAPFTMGAPAKAQLISPKLIVITTEPINSNGRRPKRSIVRIARNVVTTFVTEVMTVIIKLSVVLKPTDFHNELE